MARDMNKWIGVGRLGADPEVRKTRDGDPIANIRIAVGNSWKDRDGNKKESTEWVPVVVFGHAADYVDRYVKKGDKVLVEGQFKTREWEDRDGNKRYTSEIVVDDFNGSISTMAQAGGGSSDRSDDRDRGGRDDRDRGRGRDDDGRGRDRDDRGSSRSRGRDDDRDRGRGGRDDDRRGSDRGRDDDRGRGREDDRRTSKSLDDDIPF